MTMCSCRHRPSTTGATPSRQALSVASRTTSACMSLKISINHLSDVLNATSGGCFLRVGKENTASRPSTIQKYRGMLPLVSAKTLANTSRSLSTFDSKYSKKKLLRRSRLRTFGLDEVLLVCVQLPYFTNVLTKLRPARFNAAFPIKSHHLYLNAIVYECLQLVPVVQIRLPVLRKKPYAGESHTTTTCPLAAPSRSVISETLSGKFPTTRVDSDS